MQVEGGKRMSFAHLIPAYIVVSTVVCYTRTLCFKVLNFKDIQSETVAWLLAYVKSSSASRSLLPPPYLRRTLYSYTQYLLLRPPLYHRCHACNSLFCALHSYSRFLLAPKRVRNDHPTTPVPFI
jgi:hypothetical protein